MIDDNECDHDEDERDDDDDDDDEGSDLCSWAVLMRASVRCVTLMNPSQVG